MTRSIETEPATQAETQAEALAQAFAGRFGRPATHAAAAPGRVNLIGEHTDYNDGFVLPMAIERQTVVVAARREDRTARFASEQLPGQVTIDLDAPIRPGEPAWGNYVRGVVAGCLDAGLDPGGFDALIGSSVPTGGGLSSSAALEVATATLLESLAGRTIDPTDKARLCQQADHDFVGVPCGIMDQLISASARPDAAMLIDCRSLECRPVPITDRSVAVLIINSNVAHKLVSGEYAQRRRQCEEAARVLGVSALRDADLDALEAARSRLDAVVYQRARHVIEENARTLDAADRLAAGDWPAFGELMLQSHASLRDRYEVSCPELDLLVELAMAERARGVFGSRMTGGGFGGCTVTLVRDEAARAVADAVTGPYRQRTGIEPASFVTRPAAGARPIPMRAG